MDQVPRRRRARPVGDAPVDVLRARVEGLTKGWLVALLEQTPLDAASAILAADLVRDGPRICDAVIRAIANDADLRRLEPGGALEQLVSRAGELPGVVDAAAASSAIDALHGVLWAALREELAGPEPEQVSELAERLALVMELVRGAALRRLAATEQGGQPLSAVDSEREERWARELGRTEEPTSPGEPRAAEAPSVEEDPRPEEAPAAGEEARLGEALTAEREARPGELTAEEHASAGEPRAEESASAGEPRAEEQERVLQPLRAVSAPPEALWVGALEEEIMRAERAGAALSLLLVEMEDGERVRTVEPPALASSTLGRFAQAVRDAVRRPDIIASESDARAWVIARETGRAGAQALASRLGTSVRSAEPWRGAPMTVTIGVAVLGEDGRDASSLIAAAEESRFAAAASGVEVVRAGAGEREQAGGEVDPDRGGG